MKYAVAPRFVLSCSDALLKEAHAMTGSFPGMLFHTHAAENRKEMDAVRSRCGADNIEFFDTLGILRANTCLAHCIWISEKEVALLSETERESPPLSDVQPEARVRHRADPGADLRGGSAVSLGADGAPCNNTLDMFQEMRHAALIQKPVHGPLAMPASAVFELATLGGAARPRAGTGNGEP